MTTSVNWNDPVMGFEPPVVALTVMVELPAGVPGFDWPLPLVPPQEPSHRVEKPRTKIRLKMRTPRATPFRDPVKTIPNNPGSKAA